MSDRGRACLPPPLSAICALDNRRHDRLDDYWQDDRAWICTLHDNLLAIWMRIRRCGGTG